MRFGPESVVAPQRRIEIGPESLRPGENILELTKAGQGNLYYSLRLSQYVGKESLLATITSSGVRVDRSYYRVSPQRDRGTGTVQLKPGRRPQTRFRTGDLMRVTLTLTCPTRMEYVIVEDPRPAGCEVLSRGDLYPWEWGYWYSDVDIRDRSVAFFAREMTPGQHEITYDARAAQPGRFHALPTEAYCMYRPDIRGSGPAGVIEVRK
jgi:hypothetical protein